MTDIIELGSTWHHQPDEPPPGPRRLPSRWSAVAIGVALLFSLVGEVPDGSRGLSKFAEVAIPGHTQFHIVQDVVLVTGRNEVQTYSLADGRQRGRAVVSAPLGQTVADSAGGLLWLRGFDQNSTTVVLDLDGNLRWSAPGHYGPLEAAGLALSFESSFEELAEGADPSDAPRISQVTVRDLATGAIRWTSTGVGMHNYDRERQLVLFLGPDGSFIERSVSDGAVARATTIEVSGRPVNLNIDGGVLEIMEELVSEAGKTSSRFLDVSTLRPASVRTERRVEESCGPYRCGWRIVNGEYAQKEILDVGSGEVLFRVDPERDIQAVPAGMLLISFSDQHELATGELVDPLTGQTLVNLSPWLWVRGPQSQVLLQPDQRNRVNHVGWLTATGVRPRGSVPANLGTCRASLDLMVCPEPGERLGFWRIGH